MQRDVESVLDWCIELVNTLNRDGGGEEVVLCVARGSTFVIAGGNRKCIALKVSRLSPLVLVAKVG